MFWSIIKGEIYNVSRLWAFSFASRPVQRWGAKTIFKAAGCGGLRCWWRQNWSWNWKEREKQTQNYLNKFLSNPKPVRWCDTTKFYSVLFTFNDWWQQVTNSSRIERAIEVRNSQVVLKNIIKSSIQFLSFLVIVVVFVLVCVKKSSRNEAERFLCLYLVVVVSLFVFN